MSVVVGERISWLRRVPGAEWLLLWLDRARALGAGVVISNAGSLIGTAIVTSGLGIVFWWLAARTFPPAAVGLAAAAVSATGLLGVVSVLGFGTLLIGELASRPGEQSSLLATAILVTGVCGAVLGGVLAIVGPTFVSELRPLGVGPLTVFLCSLAVASTAVGLVLDQFLVGMLRSDLQLVRNALYAVSKLLMLGAIAALVVDDQALTIFATWPLGNLLSILAVAGFVGFRGRLIPLAWPEWRILHRLGASALTHHALNLSLQTPALTLPVLVTVLLSATVNAYFYSAWMIASVAFVPQTALAVTLFAVAAREPAALARRARLTLALGFGMGFLAILVVLVGAERFVAIFGAAYVDQASASLRILVLGVLAIVVKTHYVALSRVQRHVALASLVVAAGAFVELGLAAFGAILGGLVGLCVGWLAGLCLEAICMAPTVWRVAASPSAE